MPLDQRFVQELMQLLTNPPLLTDLSLHVFFPEVARDFATWNKMHTRPVSHEEMYEWLQKKFPGVPDGKSFNNADDAFREMFKCIVCKALNVGYVAPIKIVD